LPHAADWAILTPRQHHPQAGAIVRRKPNIVLRIILSYMLIGWLIL